MTNLSDRANAAADELRVIFDFFQTYRKDVADEDVVADLTFGNPHEMPLPELVETLKTHIEPKRVDWFAYKTSEEEPREAVAAALGKELNLPFAPEDIAMTQGAFGAIALAFTLLMDPGDECILPVPGWFCYTTILRAQNSLPVTVPLLDGSFNLDIDAIERAITPRTRIVVVNSPHNPTGVIYSREHLTE